MRVTLPHTLTKDEVCRRMRAHADEIGGYFPPGLARVTIGWPSEDRMSIVAEVVGQSIPGAVEVRDTDVVIELKLPLLLSVMKGPVEAKVRKEGERLLAP